jgi:teichuronic acid biosynthesis glycosyltransferase TuaG
MTNTLVSVIMPAYNAADFIEESIRCVQAQTYSNWELIVVDDGSIDQTATIVKALMGSDIRIKYIYQQNQRLGAARNTGLKAAQGDWIAYLDSDDIWMPQKLEKQLQVASEYNADVVFSKGYILANETQQLTPYESVYGLYQGADIYKQLNFANPIPVLAVIMKRSIVTAIGLQDTDPKAYGCEDWDYWLRISKAGMVFYGINEFLFKYRVHSNGMSQNRLRMQLSECFVIYKNLEPALLTIRELNDVKIKLLKLVKYIVPQLFNTVQANLIPYFLGIPISLFKKTQYNFALISYQLLGVYSKKLVQFFLSPNLYSSKKAVLGIFNSSKKSLKNSLFPSFNARILKELSASARNEIGKDIDIQEPFGFYSGNKNYRIVLRDGVQFRRFCNILVHPKAELVINKNVFFNNYCSINCLGKITIGANTLFGEGVKIYDHNHEYAYKEGQLKVERDKFKIDEVNIGSNCWIGSNVTILKGVTIGDNTIIGAGNLIYKSVPSNTVVKLKSETV